MIRRSEITAFAAASVAAVGFLACASTVAPPMPVEPPPEPEVPAEEAATESETYSNTLKWSTASEVDNFGFDVYRGTSEEGPFERLTESPIEGSGTSDLTNSYAYEDTTIDPSVVYYYYVESISLQGVREQFTPIIRAKAKLPEEDAGGDEPADAAEEQPAEESGANS